MDPPRRLDRRVADQPRKSTRNSNETTSLGGEHMPVRRVWNCDLPDCTNRAVGDDVPDGWTLVRQNHAGLSDTVLCSTEHLVTWTGAVAAPAKPTVAQARAVLAEWRAANPRGGRGE